MSKSEPRPASDPVTPADELMPLVYSELRRLASAWFRGIPKGRTLQPTALVHEAYVRLAERSALRCKSQTHFFNIAARAMRNVLVDHARARNAKKRGADLPRVTLSSVEGAVGSEGHVEVDHLDLVAAIEDLSRLNARHAEVVVLRFFGGLTVREIADEMGVSFRTIENDWRMARAWLLHALNAAHGS